VTKAAEADEKLDEAIRYRDSYGAPGGPDGKKCWEYYGDPTYLTLDERAEIRQQHSHNKGRRIG
jgi:hypothetical protein